MRALVSLGFRIRHAGKGTTMLQRGHQMVMVPLVDVLTDDLVDSILRSAGVSAREIALAANGSATRSGTYRRTGTEPNRASGTDEEDPMDGG